MLQFSLSATTPRQHTAIGPFVARYGREEQQVQWTGGTFRGSVRVADAEEALLLWQYLCHFGTDKQRSELAKFMAEANASPELTLASSVREVPQLSSDILLVLHRHECGTIGDLVTHTIKEMAALVSGKPNSDIGLQRKKVTTEALHHHGFRFKDDPKPLPLHS